jgi:tetratricopeptide (TPR) repeat protein
LKSFPSHPDLARISNQGPAEEVPVIETESVSTTTPEVITAPPVEPEPSPEVIEQPNITPELDLDAIVEDAANLIKQNQPEQGLELLRDLLHNEASQHPRAWRVAAASMARLSLIDNAIEAFTYALDLDNTDAASWYNLGALHRRNGHEETAVTCFDAALGLRPDYTKASYC